MANLPDVMHYLLSHAGERGGLPNARLTKMIYLADWRSCIERGEQITDVRWYFDHFGPYVFDVVEAARANPDSFTVRSEPNAYGSPSTVIGLAPRGAECPVLPPEAREVLDHVVQSTVHRTWSDFIRLVYSTYPVLKSPRYTYLDLPALADEYRAVEGVA